MTNTDLEGGDARYVFRVSFRLEPTKQDVSVDPAAFETTLFRAAAAPGEAGWSFFRDNLWRGELNDTAHFRELTDEALEVSVSSVSFAELRTDERYLAALKREIAANLGEFNAENADRALSKYLGSSIRVVDVD